MNFETFWKNRPRGIYTDEDYARLAWDAAIDAAREEKIIAQQAAESKFNHSII